MRTSGLRRRLWRVALLMLVAGPRTDLLDLEARRRLHEYVTKYPGLHLREIARATGFEMNHAKYHLLYMQKHGLISSRRDEGYWRFFPLEEGRAGWRDQVPAPSKGILGLLRRPIPLHITLLLLEQGELNQTQILERVGIAASTLHYHLGHMEKANLLVSERRGRERVCKLADPKTVVGLLVRYRPPPSLVADFLEAWEQLDLDALTQQHAGPVVEPIPDSEPDVLAGSDEFAEPEHEGGVAVTDVDRTSAGGGEPAPAMEKEGEEVRDASLRRAAGAR